MPSTPAPEVNSEHAGRQHVRTRVIIAAVAIYLVCAAASLTSWLTGKGPLAPLFTPQSTISISDARATAEAYTFATAQANSESTGVAVRATNTSLAQASATARAESSATALAYANSTATASMKATAEAPATLTAIARSHIEDEAMAAATVQALEQSASGSFGPAGGTLDHEAGPICKDVGLNLENFIVQARFYNPYAPSEQGWDYGFRFTRVSGGSEDDNPYYDIALDSGESLSLRLGAPGYYIERQDTTFDPIDLSASGSNLLKLYLLGEEIHVYINERYSTTLDLHSVDFGNDFQPGPLNIAICTGLKDDDTKQGASTRYEDFTVWELP